ncbi:MAG: SUMF1/EgtB/PvdO family nonheme iron enzyme [Phycisphaerae bacterium]
MGSMNFGRTLGFAVAASLLGANAVRATDLFNLGGIQDSTTGSWTGSASLTMVPVGNPGNAADPYNPHSPYLGPFGSVGYTYNVGKYDVTAAQYTAFLNAVASTNDSYNLYNLSMATGNLAACGIIRTPVTGGYSYSVDTQHQNYPVNNVSWGDAARFCNWLSNGQPTGIEGNGTTETGSYTLNGVTDFGGLMAITRNPGATYVIPTANEWYKAAYYDPSLNNGLGGYWLYPTKSNSIPTNVLSSTGTNNANYYDNYGTGNGGYTDSANRLTVVGAFMDSPSAYNTYDQGGNVWQWNEANIFIYTDYYMRGMRGGSFLDADVLMSSGRDASNNPTVGDYTTGFRVAEVPEPTSVGLLGLGIIGMLARRRKKA